MDSEAMDLDEQRQSHPSMPVQNAVILTVGFPPDFLHIRGSW